MSDRLSRMIDRFEDMVAHLVTDDNKWREYFLELQEVLKHEKEVN